MHGALVELLRRQHRREYRHLGLQLHVHQRLDHGVGDEFVAVDAAVDHEARGHDRGVAPRLGEDLRMQRYLERAGHLEQIDLRCADVARLDLFEEGDAAFLAPPRGARTTARRRPAAALRNADAPAPADAREYPGGLDSTVWDGIGFRLLATSDSWLSSFRTRIRAYGTTSPTRKCAKPPQPFSFIRTLTVGFGITRIC